MSIDSKNICLSAEQREQLAFHSQRTGRPWDEILSEALAHICRKRTSSMGVIGLFADEPALIDRVVNINSLDH